MISLKLKFLFVLSISTQLSIAKPTCYTYGDCKTCASHSSWSGEICRWCPLDRACHEPFSPRNPCIKNEDIVNPQMCWGTKYGKYNPVSAYLYTLMSAAAYSMDPKTCLKKINLTQFEIKDIFKQSCEKLPLFSYNECFAYTAVSRKRRLITLAFRGTEFPGTQIIDQIISVLTTPKTPFPTGGNVQRYFANAHDKLYRRVNESVTNLVKMYPSYSFVVTGHSLGGALASLAAVSLVHQKVLPSSRLSLYTFGEPRVGDKEFVYNFNRLVNNSWRVVHSRDIFSHLPTCQLIGGCSMPINGPYQHKTEIFYPNVSMKTDSYYIQCRGDDSYNCSGRMIWNNPCTTDLAKCIDCHVRYFDIHLGKFCTHV